MCMYIYIYICIYDVLYICIYARLDGAGRGGAPGGPPSISNPGSPKRERPIYYITIHMQYISYVYTYIYIYI